MALIVERINGTSGRTAPGFDYYTGMMFYGTAPSTSGWITSTNPVTIKQRQIFSAADALSKGILPNTDNTASTGTYVITTKGNTADTLKITCTYQAIDPSTETITSITATLATYTVPSGDNTIALQVTAITAAINALTFSTGFSAVASLSTTVTIIAPTFLGKSINSGTPYVVTITGAFVATLTQNVIAGTASLFAVVYYHISEYYRMNPTGNLTIGFISASSSWKELLALEIASGGQLRQIGAFDTNTSNGLAANILNTVEAIQTTVATLDTPFEVVYQPNITAVSDLSTMPNGNLNTTGTNVQVIITQDGNSQGALLYIYSGYSIGNLGANLGCLSASRVSASIAQPIQKFNVSNGVENAVPGLANGTLLSALSNSLYQQLFGTVQNNVSGYCYIGFSIYTGRVSGTFFSGNAMFTAQSSTYAFMNDNRVWDKITRIIQTTYTPFLNSEILFNQDGTISNNDIVSLEGAGESAIAASMITGQNPPLISGSPSVTIDPTQKVKDTNTLLVQVEDEENGIIRNIIVSNGLN